MLFKSPFVDTDVQASDPEPLYIVAQSGSDPNLINDLTLFRPEIQIPIQVPKLDSLTG